jgi:Flp pilus assembly CpaF family ATPase
MSAVTSGRVAGTTGSGKASVLSSLRSAVDAERQILVRVDRAIHIGERELRYQLERKNRHPLASRAELLDVLAELEERGLVESELGFRLTVRGREVLAALPAVGG